MPTLLEQLVNELNQAIFFREFSFSQNEFWPSPDQQKEFADHVIWLGDSLIVFQVKEREVESVSAEVEEQWFNKKVIAKASKQVRDTLRFLDTCPEIPITNQHSQKRILKAGLVDRNKVVKIVLYLPSEYLPVECRQRRHHISNSAGYNFLHVLPWDHYQEICQTLVTPAELIEYFEFRQAVLEKAGTGTQLPSEQALLGQFLSGNLTNFPSEIYIEYLTALDRDNTDFDLSWLLHRFKEKTEKVIGSDDFNEYQRTLVELAKLKRSELKEVNLRIQLCLQAARVGKFHPPTRIISTRTGCGFLFVTVEPEMFPNRINFLSRLVSGSMYEQRLEKHVGVVFFKDGGDFTVDWCFGNYPHIYDEELEQLLKHSNPFMDMRSVNLKAYSFKGRKTRD